jgi:hypothetical protein
LTVSFGAGAIGACALTALLAASGLVDSEAAPSRQLTLFIERPDWLSVVVALLAGVAGALAITLPDARGGRRPRVDHDHPRGGEHRCRAGEP